MFFVVGVSGELFRRFNLIRPFMHVQHVAHTILSVYFNNITGDSSRSTCIIAPLDPSTIPFHLRPHINPSIRKVYLDLPLKDTNSDSKTSSLNTATLDSSQTLSLEVARLRAEVEALRYNCSMWRRRAEVHSLSTVGFLELWRTTREQLTQTCRERDTIQKNYLELNHNFHRQQ